MDKLNELLEMLNLVFSMVENKSKHYWAQTSH